MPNLKKFLCLSCLILAACASNGDRAAENPDSTPLPPVPSSPQNPSTPPNPVSQAPVPNPVFESVLPRLQQETQVPILLPDYIFGSDGATPVYANIETVTPSQYQLILGFTPDCNGGTACRIGTVSGETISPELPALEGKTVPLDNDITGYFTEAVCAANCSDATVAWEENGARYLVGIKAGKPEDLVQMANSAIATGTF